MFDQNTTNTSIILDSLHPDYVYEFQVAAYTVAAGPFSTIFAVQVLMAGIYNVYVTSGINNVYVYCFASSSSIWYS